MLIKRPSKTRAKKTFPQSLKMISPRIDALVDSDIMPAPRRKTLVRKRTMIEIAYTAVDVFGCFGLVDAVATTFVCPTGAQVCCALYHAECGDVLDAMDQTIVDMCLAGF
jgi:hypothetical protein